MMKYIEIFSGLNSHFNENYLSDHETCIILKSPAIIKGCESVKELSEDIVNKILKIHPICDNLVDISMETYLNLDSSFSSYGIYDVIDSSWSDNEKLLFLRLLDDSFCGGMYSLEDYLLMYFNLVNSGLDNKFLNLSVLYNYYKNVFEKTPEKLWLNVSILFIFENVISFLERSTLSICIHEKFIDYILSVEGVFENENFLIKFLIYIAFNNDLIRYFLSNLHNDSLINDVLLSLKDKPFVFSKYYLVLIELLDINVIKFSFFESVLLNNLFKDTICSNDDVVERINFNYSEYYKGVVFNTTQDEMNYLFDNITASDFVLILKFLIEFDDDFNKHLDITVWKLKHVIDKMIRDEYFVSEFDFKIIVEFVFLYSGKANGLSSYILKLAEFYPEDLPVVLCLRHKYIVSQEFSYTEMKEDFVRNVTRPEFLKNLSEFELIEVLGLSVKYRITSSYILSPIFNKSILMMPTLKKDAYIQVIRYLLKLRIFFSGKMIDNFMLNISDFKKRGVLELLWVNILFTSYPIKSHIIYAIIESKINDLPSSYVDLFDLMLPLKRLRVQNLNVAKIIMRKIIQTFMVNDILFINDNNIKDATHLVFRLVQMSKVYPGEFDDDLNLFFYNIDNLIMSGIKLLPFAKVDYVYAMMIAQRKEVAVLKKILPFEKSDIKEGDRFNVAMAYRASHYFNFSLDYNLEKLFWSYSERTIKYENASEKNLFYRIKQKFADSIVSIELNVFDESSLGYEMDILIVSKKGVRINVEFDGVGHSGFLDASRDEYLKRRNQWNSSIGAAYILRVKTVRDGVVFNASMKELEELLSKSS